MLTFIYTNLQRLASLTCRQYVVIAVILFAIVFLPCGVLYHGDGAARLSQAESIVTHFQLTEPAAGRPPLTTETGGMVPLADGSRVSKYGIGMPILWSPAVAFAKVAGACGLPYKQIVGFLISLINPIITVLTGLCLWGYLKGLGKPVATRRAVLVCWILGTSAVPYANSAFSEPLCGLLILAGVMFAVCKGGASTALCSGALIGWTTHVKPEFAVLAIAIPVTYCISGYAKRGIIIGLVALMVGPGLLLAINWIVYGSVTRSSYGDEASRFVMPTSSLLGLTIGIDKSLFLYNPAVLLAALGWFYLRRDSVFKMTFRVVVVSWLIYLPLYASWWAWEGGLCFGPRFFVSLMPVTMLGLAGLPWSRLFSTLENRLATASLALVVILLSSVQWVGFSLHDEQTAYIAKRIGQSRLEVGYRLAAMKLTRGIWTEEQYTAADFGVPNGQRIVFDFSNKETFHAFRHWPLYIIGSKLH